MPKATNISLFFRHLLVSVTLLWALMLNGQEVVAYTQTAQQHSSQLATPAHESKTVVKQKVSLEGTTSFVILNLSAQQDLEPLPEQPDFAAAHQMLLPAYTAVPPGTSAVTTLFPITIQPNAP